ncbi:MAG: cytochrome C [Desulfobacteraceae bacterium]|nr:MAG: cytochrome C [Desulfobacteraceae bacterium]
MLTPFKRVALLAIVLLAAGSLISFAAPPQDPGAPEMMLAGGTSGKVPFPHLRHQQMLTDCNLCHLKFPQTPGAIEALKTEGKLAKKEVMNTVCTKCHKEKKLAGEASGPTTCTTCHVKG